MVSHSLICCWLICLLFPYPGLGMTGGNYFIIAYPQFQKYETPVVLLHITTEISPLTVNVKFGSQETNAYQVRFSETVALNPSITFPPVGYGECYSVTSEGGLFDVTVAVKLTASSSALFKAIPVSSWGTVYGAVILWYNPVIQIVAASNCYVRLFVYSMDVKFSISFEGKQYGPNSTLDVMINRLESFTLSGHTTSAQFVDQISGTNISSSGPIGVISGSSPGTVFDPECLSISLSTNEDMALEMLPPVEHYHSYFITSDFKKLTRHNYLIVMAAENATAVTIKDVNGTRHILLDLALFPYKINVAASVLVTSTKPVTVVNVLSSGCLDRDVYHGPSMGVVVPYSFLYATYHFVAPSLTGNTQAFVQIIHSNLNLSELVYDDRELEHEMVWEVHPVELKFSVGTMTVTVDQLHVIYDSAETPFWCNAFGYTAHGSYVFFAGHAGPDIVHDVTATTPPRRKVTRPACIINVMKPGDRIDNDCDDQRDEEKMNKEDDDWDGLIDEDLERNPHQECETGMFGKRCDKMCYCAEACNRKGDCIGENTKCVRGFYGRSCHYVDFAVESSLKYQSLKDNDDSTCITLNMSEQSIHIEFPAPKVFSMMRIVWKELNSRDFNVIFQGLHSSNYLPCPAKQQIKHNPAGAVLQVVDIYCQPEGPVVALLLQSDGDVSLCTINISGGRTFGYMNVPRMSSTYMDYDNNFAWADVAVDGIKGTGHQGTLLCARTEDSDLDPFWELKLDEPISLYYVLIYNSVNSIAMDWFVLEIFNENNVKVGEYLNYEGRKPIFEIPFTITEPVMRFRVSLSLKAFPEKRSAATTIQICEFEAYGDCMPPAYGPDCLDICSLTCVDQRCGYSGECLSCPQGVSGKHCMDTTQRDKNRDDMYEDHHLSNTTHRRLPVAVWRVEHTAYYVIVFSFIGILALMNRNMNQERDEKFGKMSGVSLGGTSSLVHPIQVVMAEGTSVDIFPPPMLKTRYYPTWKLHRLVDIQKLFRRKVYTGDDSETSTAI